MKKIESPREFFLSRGIVPKKALGQSFLVDLRILERIGEIAELSGQDEVVEIGAGLGVLTTFLGERVKRVIAIEKDPRFIDKLKEITVPFGNIELVHQDALGIEFKKFYLGNKLKVVSNLPYSVSSPILIKLLDEREVFSLMVLMVQKEVGERIVASPGTKAYGSISVLIQTYMDAEIKLHVPPSAFWPQPKVESVVLKLIPLSSPRVNVPDERFFRRVVKAAFSSRRKILANSLSSIFPRDMVEAILKAAEIDRKRRAETLSLEEFGRIAHEAFIRSA
ncbi:MAG: ribosomal RNA small subunit methyltransferase A [Deltaproteobacteria bacterium]|nr:MAG: ribosomal RNA small subunit methyltransferase A [Deltaproteobacteria bacterium]